MMGSKRRLDSRASSSAPSFPGTTRTGSHLSHHHGRCAHCHWNNPSRLLVVVLCIGYSLIAVTAGGTDAVPKDVDGDRERARPPLRVFLLAGQSNMEGHGFVHAPPSPPPAPRSIFEHEEYGPPTPLNGTLEWQLHVDHAHIPLCRTMRTPPAGTHCRAEGADFSDLYDPDAGEWRTFSNVHVAFKGSIDRHGPLSVGYGLKDWWIGPEYGFGRTMGRYYDHNNDDDDDEKSDVLLLKVAWGGTDLEYDWRPPRSGTPPPTKKNTPSRPNWAYTNFTNIVRSVLANDLEDLVPTFSYGRGDTYELSGLGWHQGWNDGCSDTEVRDYGENMANLIRDLRDEFQDDVLHHPLPVVIGTSGFGGWDEANPRRLGIMRAQYGTSLRDDLVPGTVAAVDTRGFWRPYDETHGAIDQCYHWYGNGETYYHVGTAMGEAMVRLLDGTWRQPPMHENVGPVMSAD